MVFVFWMIHVCRNLSAASALEDEKLFVLCQPPWTKTRRRLSRLGWWMRSHGSVLIARDACIEQSTDVLILQNGSKVIGRALPLEPTESGERVEELERKIVIQVVEESEKRSQKQ